VAARVELRLALCLWLEVVKLLVEHLILWTSVPLFPSACNFFHPRLPIEHVFSVMFSRYSLSLLRFFHLKRAQSQNIFFAFVLFLSKNPILKAEVA
jgi:heme/copper-type cytochrome/quinol oxidase subunit 4